MQIVIEGMKKLRLPFWINMACNIEINKRTWSFIIRRILLVFHYNKGILLIIQPVLSTKIKTIFTRCGLFFSLMLFVCVIVVILVQKLLKRQTYNDQICLYFVCISAKQVWAFRFYGLGSFLIVRKYFLTFAWKFSLIKWSILKKAGPFKRLMWKISVEQSICMNLMKQE